MAINVIDSIDVEWTSNFPEAWLYLWCDEQRSPDEGTLTYTCMTPLSSLSQHTTS